MSPIQPADDFTPEAPVCDFDQLPEIEDSKEILGASASKGIKRHYQSSLAVKADGGFRQRESTPIVHEEKLSNIQALTAIRGRGPF